MKTYISLLRGINVGGHRKIRMAEVRSLFEKLGFENVRTYLQSGNVVFSDCRKSESFAAKVEAAVLTEFGFEVSVLVFDAKSFGQLVDGNPLAGATGPDSGFLHLTFLFGRRDAIEVDAIPLGKGERAEFQNGHYYLYCPNGYGKTKINNSFFERKLKLPATTRNWKTVLALREMAEN